MVASSIPRELAEITTLETIKNGVSYTPRADIYETAEEFVVLADLPGVKPENLELKIYKGELSVHGKIVPRPETIEPLTSEYGVGDFLRLLTIPPEVDVDRIKAELKMGVLTMHLPKIEAVRPRTIPINAE